MFTQLVKITSIYHCLNKQEQCTLVKTITHRWNLQFMDISQNM